MTSMVTPFPTARPRPDTIFAAILGLAVLPMLIGYLITDRRSIIDADVERWQRVRR